MLANKRNEIKDIYLDDGIPALDLDLLNEANFQRAYHKFEQELKNKYTIEPKILAIVKNVEEEFQNRKSVQNHINEKIEEERNLENKYNDLFPKKSHINPPYYKLKSQKSPSKQETASKNELNPSIFNKSTQTINQQVLSQMLINSAGNIKNNPDFNLNRRKPTNPKTRDVSSETKKRHINENFSRHSPSSDLKKNNSVLQNVSKNNKDRIMSSENNALSFKNEVNKVLLEAKSLIMKKKIPEAEKTLETLIRKNVNHADLFYLMGETKRLLGNFETAEEMLLKSMSFEMHSPFCYYSLALVYMQLKNLTRAINLWKIFLKIKQDSVSGYFELAKCYFETEEYIEAASCLNKAIEFDESNPDFFLMRAQAFELLNLEESSKNDYKQFKRLCPDFELKYGREIRNMEDFGFFEEAVKLKNFVRKIKML